MKKFKTIIDTFLLENNIKAKFIKDENYGRAYINKRMVEIPNPTNIYKFTTGIHEICHILENTIDISTSYNEYIAIQRTRKEFKKLGLVYTKLDNFRDINEMLYSLAFDLSNKEIPLHKISKNVIEFINIDVKLWNNKISKNLYPIPIKGETDYSRIKIKWVDKIIIDSIKEEILWT